MGTEYTNIGRQYTQLSLAERGKIEAFYSLKFSISEIARLMNRSKSTIFKEIQRGEYKGKYTAHIAQQRSEKRRKKSHKHRRLFLCNGLSCTGQKFSHTSIYTLIKNIVLSGVNYWYTGDASDLEIGKLIPCSPAEGENHVLRCSLKDKLACID